jgi:nucleoid DNA-binding protein
MNWKEVNENRKVINEELYEEVAHELNIPVHRVKEFMQVQSDFIAKVIGTGALETVMLPYMGKIRVNHKKAQIVNSMKKPKI